MGEYSADFSYCQTASELFLHINLNIGSNNKPHRRISLFVPFFAKQDSGGLGESQGLFPLHSLHESTPACFPTVRTAVLLLSECGHWFSTRTTTSVQAGHFFTISTAAS
jgi:hypothetical protein